MAGDKGKGKKTIVGDDTPRRRRNPATPTNPHPNPVSDVYRPIFDFTQISPEATRHALATFPSPNMPRQPTSPRIPFEMLQIGAMPQYTPSPLTRPLSQIHTSSSHSSHSSTQFSTSVSLDWTSGNFQNLITGGSIPEENPGLEDFDAGFTQYTAGGANYNPDGGSESEGEGIGGTAADAAVNSPTRSAHRAVNSPTRGGRRGGRGGRRAGGSRWSWTEDEVLLNCWLHVSQDATVGADRTGDSFWKLVYYTCRQSHIAQFFHEKSESAVKKHFYDIHGKVKKFASFYARAERNAVSGSNEASWLKEAISNFTAYVGPWHLHNQWVLLRQHPAWFVFVDKSKELGYARRKPAQSGSTSSGKRSRSGESEDADQSASVPRFPMRPPGRDASKKSKADAGPSGSKGKEKEKEKEKGKGKGKGHAIDEEIKQATAAHKASQLQVRKMHIEKTIRAEKKRRDSLGKSYTAIRLADKAGLTPEEIASDKLYLEQTARDIEESMKMQEELMLELATLNSVEHLISSDSD